MLMLVLPGLCDIVVCFRLQSQWKTESIKLNDKVKEFILNFLLDIVEFERAVPFHSSVLSFLLAVLQCVMKKIGNSKKTRKQIWATHAKSNSFLWFMMWKYANDKLKSIMHKRHGRKYVYIFVYNTVSVLLSRNWWTKFQKIMSND